MKKKVRRLLAGIGLFALLFLLGGCYPAANPGKDEREKTPYSLYGEQEGWEVSCVVRAMTQAEKDEELANLEQAKEGLDTLLSDGELDQENYQKLKEQYERTAQNLKEKDAYISSVSGVCRNEETLGQSFTYRLADGGGAKVVEGTQTASDEPGEWYSSYQMDGRLFIPAMEKATFQITLGDKTVTIPLPLELYTNKEIS